MKKLAKGLYEVETLLSCAHYIQVCIVLVLIYKKNDPLPTLQTSRRLKKSGSVDINENCFAGLIIHHRCCFVIFIFIALSDYKSISTTKVSDLQLLAFLSLT